MAGSRRRECATLWVKPETRDAVNKKKEPWETQDSFLKRILKLLVIVGMLAVVVAVPVAATSMNFQSESDMNRITNLTYRTDHDLANQVKYIRGGAATNYNNYVGYWQQRVSGGCVGDTIGTDEGGIVLTNPVYMTYAAGTFRGVSASCVLPASMAVTLWDVNKNRLLTTAYFSHSYNITPSTGDRMEMKVVGGTTYIFNNGRPVYQGGSLAQNPSYVSFGTSTWSEGVEYIYWDDLIYGETENKYVLGLPETDGDLIILLKDIINPASSGVAFGENSTILNSNYLYGTWARGNSSIQPGTQPNKTIQFVNINTGEVIQTNYTGTDYAGTFGYNVRDLLFNADKENGYYAMYYPDELVYSNVILYRSNGASVAFDKDEYSRGDEATVIYYVLDGGYWDTSLYSYKIAIVSAFGEWKGNTSLSASSGQVTHSWLETDEEGVYSAWLIATDHDGHEYILGADSAELTAYFGISGYVNNAQNQTTISNAIVNITQGVSVLNQSSGSDGNYSTNSTLTTGSSVFVNVTANGYRQYAYSFTPLAARSLNINISLVQNSPLSTSDGLGIGGIARDTVYGRPLEGVNISIVNQSNGEQYYESTNPFGWYLCYQGSACTVTRLRPYTERGTKIGYGASENYTVIPDGVLS